MDPLFPELPEDLAALPEEDLGKLIADHESAIELIKADDEEFLKGLSGAEVIEQLTSGVAQMKNLRDEQGAREAAHENYLADKEKALAELEAPAEETEDEALEVVAEESGDEGDGDGGDEGDSEEEKVEDRELVLASAETPIVRYSRTPPAPSASRTPVEVVEPEKGTALVAAGGYRGQFGDALTASALAALQHTAANELGPLPKTDPRGKYRSGADVSPHGFVVYDGPKTKTAMATYDFPAERTLSGDPSDNVEKIRAILPENVTFFGESGGHGGEALTASGGLCAPLTPLYSMPNFATEAEPVWDSLPTFRAVRGGVNVPTPTYIADITEAISSISEADDALGGTFATKSCQDLECPDYTETAVQILAHCREYGNMNARAWPEKIAHENALTMAALSRTSEGFMLDRIKALSVNVTNGAETLGALIYLIDAIVKARFGIIGRLRMPRNTRFRALIPFWVPAMLQLDTIQTQFDRFRSEEELVAYLRSAGIDPVFYLDTPSTGTTQLPDAAQTAAAIDPLPDNVQWAIYPEGAFLGLDMGVLELGIVRDSTLNSTNDFQVFGERFRNVALIAPQQAAYWVTSDLCASGQFPPAGTVRTCD
jgi:hypothetical protein